MISRNSKTRECQIVGKISNELSLKFSFSNQSHNQHLQYKGRLSLPKCIVFQKIFTEIPRNLQYLFSRKEGRGEEGGLFETFPKKKLSVFEKAAFPNNILLVCAILGRLLGPLQWVWLFNALWCSQSYESCIINPNIL